MSFYVHLFSNGSSNYFPENRISLFRNKLPKTVICDQNKIEVALTEISYVKSFKQFNSLEDRLIRFSYVGDVKDIHISNIHYGTIEQLIEEIKSSIPKTISKDIIDFYITKKRVVLNLSSITGLLYLRLSKKLSSALGFDDLVFNVPRRGNKSELTVGEHAPNLNIDCSKIMVYSDIIEDQIVSDSYVPLLRVIPLTGNENENVTFSPRPEYVDINRSSLDTIKVFICNEFGEELMFMKGVLSITLHFRNKEVKNGGDQF